MKAKQEPNGVTTLCIISLDTILYVSSIFYLLSAVSKTQKLNDVDSGQRHSSGLTSFILQSPLLKGVWMWNFTDDVVGDNL